MLMMRRLFTIYFAAAIMLALGSVVQLIKISVSSELTSLHNVYPLPLAKLKVDGQSVSLLVDTGTAALFLVWKTWFEDPYQTCNDLIFGCYECKPSCQEGPTKDLCFEDDTCVSLFPHNGTFDFGLGLSIDEINFGLVAHFSDNPWRIWASLGLKPADSQLKPHLSIVQQLASKKVIPDQSLSIFFNQEDFASGEIILGGEDQSKQEGPLKFFKIIDNEELFVQLHGLQVGNDPEYLINMSVRAAFDTGSTHIFINRKWKSQVVNFLQEAGKKKFSIRQEESELAISCSDIENVPSMTFIMEGLEGEEILFEVTPRALVWIFEGECFLRLHFDGDDDIIIFGMPAFSGNYYYFPSDGRSIGYTKSNL